MPLFAQIMFFGALLSAIKSCASATLLAPAVSFSENIVKGFFINLTPKQLLFIMRCTVFAFNIIVTFIAIHSELSIFKMVESAYKITLVAAFIPLVFGIYWKKANPMGGLLSVLIGLAVWILMELFIPDFIVPPQMCGLFGSLGGMLLGGLLIPQNLLVSTKQLNKKSSV